MLLVLPECEAEWTALTENALILRRCAYWISLKGEASTENMNSVRIRIPRTNIFSVEALSGLMRQARIGEDL